MLQASKAGFGFFATSHLKQSRIDLGVFFIHPHWGFTKMNHFFLLFYDFRTYCNRIPSTLRCEKQKIIKYFYIITVLLLRRNLKWGFLIFYRLKKWIPKSVTFVKSFMALLLVDLKKWVIKKRILFSNV